MSQGFKFRAYPTPQQAHALVQWIGCQRVIYNAKVQEDRYFRSFARKSLTHTGQFAPQDQQYAHFISDETAWLREVPSVILRNGAVRWKQAYARFFKKLGGRPKLQKKTGAQSVWITSELFSFEPQTDKATGEIRYRLLIGTKKFPIGEVEFKAHRAFEVPASIIISVDAGRWHVSFSNEMAPLPSKRDIADGLATLSEADLTEKAVGLDRGIVIPFCGSNGANFDLSVIQKSRIAKRQAAAMRWQRKLSRRVKGGSNRRKAIRRIATLRDYEHRVRHDFAHQTSHSIVADPEIALIVFEALGVQRMTKKAAPKQDENGRWIRNGKAAKAGLNKAILGSAWSKTKTCCDYKAQRAGKLVIEVPAHHTSQECSRCGHIHPGNRPTQADFVCQACGFMANADSNASTNIRNRGVRLIVSGGYREKAKKQTMRMREKNKLGADRSEVTLGEIAVSREDGIPVFAHGSSNQETPTTTRCV